MSDSPRPHPQQTPSHFLDDIILHDKQEQGESFHLRTRFPPEPNGFLHLGHAKAICVNFGLTKKYGGQTFLRFDDTNPETEQVRYVDAIREDIRWLGFEWDRECYSSDYFEQLYEWAVALINKGLAYVDETPTEKIRQLRGDLTHPGQPTAARVRSTAENLRLFTEMKAGKHPDGSMVLRAKIDMAHQNIHMRDPILYRIKHMAHHRTKSAWCIYPMYDFAHGQSDSIENISHSICSLEFAPHRVLYDWFIETLGIFRSRQYEFARLNVSYTLMSKRKLAELVDKQFVYDWDDPRLPTLSGLRRRGFPPEAIRNFCERIGLAKRDNIIHIELLEHCVREQLNQHAQRVMVVLDPVKVILRNFPTDSTEYLTAQNNPEQAEAGERTVSFSREIYIEREDFWEDPPKTFHRLSANTPVRLKYAYIILFESCTRDEHGRVQEIVCRYLPNSKSGQDSSGVKPKGTIHWVNAKDSVRVNVNIYDRLFRIENPAASDLPLAEIINPHSLIRIQDAVGESAIRNAKAGQAFQFLRKGYFVLDKDSSAEKLTFNRTVGLKETFKLP